MLHNDFVSRQVYTWSSETLGYGEEEGIAEGKTVKAEDSKAKEGGGRFTKTLVVVTPTLNNGIIVEERGEEIGIAKGTNVAGVEEKGAGIA